jgi:methionyl-tRNA synthetase
MHCAVPTNLDGLSDEDYAKKVFYVWFDACSKSYLL